MSNLNFPRLVILVCLLASCVLGYFVYERTAYLKEVELNLKRAPRIVKEIQGKALELNALQLQAKNDLFKGIDAAESYVREIAAKPDVGIGQVTTDRLEKERSKGVRDDILRIRSATKTRPYTRSQVGNFLYSLEAGSPRVRVTSFSLTPFNKIKPGEIGDDEWHFEAELTSRTREEKGS